MNSTTKNVVIMGLLGAGLGLSVSGERRLGFWLEMAALGLTIVAYPRQTRRILRAIPKSFARTGKALGKAARRAGEAIGQAAA